MSGIVSCRYCGHQVANQSVDETINPAFQTRVPNHCPNCGGQNPAYRKPAPVEDKVTLGGCFIALVFYGGGLFIVNFILGMIVTGQNILDEGNF